MICAHTEVLKDICASLFILKFFVYTSKAMAYQETIGKGYTLKKIILNINYKSMC